MSQAPSPNLGTPAAAPVPHHVETHSPTGVVAPDIGGDSSRPGRDISGAPATGQTRAWAAGRIVRIAVWAAAAVLAAIIWVSNPTASSMQPGALPDAVSLVSLQAEANQKSAESAPHQQVVNGWHAADLLELSVLQSNLLLNAQIKTASLLAVFVIAFSVDRISSVASRKPR